MSNIRRIKIEYGGVNLIAEGEYIKGTLGSYEEAPEPSTFEVMEIYAGDVAIMSILEQSAIDEIERYGLIKLNDFF
jgi:hypothetical protein